MKKILAIILFICFLGLPFAYADQYVEEDQAAVLIVGPFLDDSDLGEETTLTVGSFTIYLYKPSASNPRSGTSITATVAAGDNHMAHTNNGYYSLQLTAGQLDTHGDARITFSYTGVLPISHDLHIRPSNVFDSLVDGTDYLQADAMQIEGTDATDQIRDHAGTKQIEGSYTAHQLLMLMSAKIAGKITIDKTDPTKWDISYYDVNDVEVSVVLNDAEADGVRIAPTIDVARP